MHTCMSIHIYIYTIGERERAREMTERERERDKERAREREIKRERERATRAVLWLLQASLCLRLMSCENLPPDTLTHNGATWT